MYKHTVILPLHFASFISSSALTKSDTKPLLAAARASPTNASRASAQSHKHNIISNSVLAKQRKCMYLIIRKKTAIFRLTFHRCHSNNWKKNKQQDEFRAEPQASRGAKGSGQKYRGPTTDPRSEENDFALVNRFSTADHSLTFSSLMSLCNGPILPRGEEKPSKTARAPAKTRLKLSETGSQNLF